ncbi:sugar phosphate nucleotidyltransferase [Virgisporangium aurantiacum]
MGRVFGVVPAAGVGSRLSPYRGPKELIQVGYRRAAPDDATRLLPMAAVEHVLYGMRTGGVHNVLLTLSPAKWDIFRYLGDGREIGLELAYLCQDEPLGMPHALDLARPFVADHTVCMGMPDTIVAPRDCFAQLLEFHGTHRADLSLGVFPTDEPQALAPVLIEPGGHRVIAVVDKPAVPPAANTWGIACWSPAFTELLHEFVRGAADTREQLLSDVFVAAMTAGLRVHGLAFGDGAYHDIGTATGVLRARARFEAQERIPAAL